LKSLDAVYEQLRPWLEARESQRKRAVHRSIVGGFGTLITAAAIAGVLALVGLPAPFLLLAAIGTLVGGMAWATAPLRALRKQVKLELNTRIASAFSMSYAPAPASPTRFEAFRDHGLVPSYTRRAFEDHFEGRFDGVEFELYEAHLEEKRETEKRTYYETVFRGALIRIAFPRTIEGVTLVTRDQGIFNALQGWMKTSFSGKNLERVGLVDPAFEKQFEVYATDQVMSRYLLTPTFMERLLRLETALKGKRIRCVFDEALAEAPGRGELLIAAETGNQFEAGSMFSTLADRKRVETLHTEISLIEEIARTLLEKETLGGVSS
jgi:hypothetical protein